VDAEASAVVHPDKIARGRVRRAHEAPAAAPGATAVAGPPEILVQEGAKSSGMVARDPWTVPALLGIAGAAWAAHANGLEGVFLYDDEEDILANPHLRSLWPPWVPLTAPMRSGLSGRPVASLSFALNHALGGLDPWGYHAVNLAIHVLAAWTLFALVRRTLRLEPLAERFGAAATPVAFAGAVLWAVHPLTTAAVTYVVHRIEALASLFLLLTLYGALGGATAGPRAAARGWYAASAAACLLGAGTKEILVGAPILVALYDRTFLAGTLRAAWRERRGLYLALAASWVLLALLVVATRARPDSVGLSEPEVGVWEYAKVQAVAIVHYLRLAVWPSPLVLDYGTPIRVSAAQWTLCGALVLALLAATVLALRRRHPAGFLGAWFFVVLAPTSSVLPIFTEIIAEHRTYAPLMSATVLAVAGAYVVGSRLLPAGGVARALGAALLLAACMPLALATRERNRDYSSQLGMWADVVAKRPENARAHACYGNELRVAGERERALEHYREAVRLAPENPYWRLNLGNLLGDLGRHAEARRELEAVAQAVPDLALARASLGRVLLASGEVTQARQEYEAALASDAGLVQAHRGLAACLERAGERALMLAHLRAALALAPDDVGLCLELASRLCASPDPAERTSGEAVELARRAVALTAARDVTAFAVLARALAEQGEFAAAATAARQGEALARASGREREASELARRAAIYGAR